MHLSSLAARSLRQQAAQVKKQATLHNAEPPSIVSLYGVVADMLEQAHRFNLPQNGDPLGVRPVALQPGESPRGYDPRMFPLVKLPYPLCALEFVMSEERMRSEEAVNASSGIPLNRSSKRVCLAFDHSILKAGWRSVLSDVCSTGYESDIPDNGFTVISVYFADSMQTWGTSMGMVSVDLSEDAAPSLKAVRTINPFDFSGESDKVMRVPGLSIVATPFILPYMESGSKEPFESIARKLICDCIDELAAAYDLFALMNCRNLNQRVVKATAVPEVLKQYFQQRGLNKREIEQRTSYRSVDLDRFISKNLAYSRAEDLEVGSFGSGRSVSPHIRRQHLRFLPKFNKVAFIPKSRPGYKALQMRGMSDAEIDALASPNKVAVMKSAVDGAAVDAALDSIRDMWSR